MTTTMTKKMAIEGTCKICKLQKAKKSIKRRVEISEANKSFVHVYIIVLGCTLQVYDVRTDSCRQTWRFGIPPL